MTKPFDTVALSLTIERALAHGALREKITRLRNAVSEQREFDEIVGTSPAMKVVFEVVSRVAVTRTRSTARGWRYRQAAWAGAFCSGME